MKNECAHILPTALKTFKCMYGGNNEGTLTFYRKKSPPTPIVYFRDRIHKFVDT